MRYAILTFGCKVNQYESNAISNDMIAEGFIKTELPEEADVVIINSCTVTETGSKKVCHEIRRLKGRNSDVIIVLTGCFSQAFPEEAMKSGADIICGTADRRKIPSYIKNYSNSMPENLITDTPEAYEEVNFSNTTGKTRAFIKIEDGCDRFCSYCIIPYARGRVRSRSLDSIKAEVEACVRDGHKEIVLVGINLSCYGKDTGLTLADAVEAVAGFEGIERVRLSSLEPELLDEAMINRLSRVKKLCPHFHLSLQSGSDGTLKRMNRHYTTDEYYEIVCNLRKAFDNPAITTDIMVGFPGETEEEFRESLAFAEKVGFGKIHVFTYSIRKGTAAEKRTDHIPEAVKQQRYKEMTELDKKLHSRFLNSQVGTIQPVLVQKRTSPDYASGLTPNYTSVRVYGSNAKKHDIINVKIIGAEEEYCSGEETV